MRTPTSKRRALTVVFAGLLAFASLPTSALAEWVDVPIVAQEELPAKFDQRQHGVVTPVKLQNPWGSCWAFGGIAAAETSILAHLGTTYDAYPLDLSERHLTWYGNRPVTVADDPEQAGEGITPTSDDYPALNLGGNNIQVSTLFSSGTGPVLERTFPYRGVNGWLESDYLKEHREESIEGLTADLMAEGMSDQESRTLAEKYFTEDLERYEKYDEYSVKDDWSIPELDAEGNSNRNIFAGFTLRDGNDLPEVALKSDPDPATGIPTWLGINEAGMVALKSSLLRGNAVEVSYAADMALPGEVENGHYMNLDNWSHYTFEDDIATHSVCVVGYDDNYPASNFTHDVYVADEDGNHTIDPELTKLSTPPGNGAFLVKNSWGSETDAQYDYFTAKDGTLGTKDWADWGILDKDGKHTGYFWLSYYDKNIIDCYTYEFDIDLDGDIIYSDLHDYLPAIFGYWTLNSKNLVSTANEFVADEDQTLTSVSTHTASTNSRVDFQIYKLAANEARPEAGELVAQFTEFYPYAGYHRDDVPVKIDLDKGQRYSIVSTVSEVNSQGQRVYSATAAMGPAKESSLAKNEALYSVAVVNPSESFLKLGDNWVDWSVYQKTDAFKKRAVDQDYKCVVDNFPIKSFSVPRQ